MRKKVLPLLHMIRNKRGIALDLTGLKASLLPNWVGPERMSSSTIFRSMFCQNWVRLRCAPNT